MPDYSHFITSPKYLRLYAVIILGLILFNLSKCDTGPNGVEKNAPLQIMLKEPIYFDTYKSRGVEIKAIASYHIRALVLDIQRYWWMGNTYKFAPLDVAVGWGYMSDQGILKDFTVTHDINHRWGWFQNNNPNTPFPGGSFMPYVANMHLIPASEDIEKRLNHITKNHFVTLDGYLVNVTIDKTGQFNTSTTRTDRGAGACEVMYVTKVLF